MNELKHRYSDNLHNKRIAVLGPVPPPLGGVSVHVQRVIAKLKAQNCDVYHFDTCVEYRYRWFYFYLMCLFFFLLRNRPSEVHLHTLYLSNGLRELELLGRLKQMLHFDIVLVEHDCRYLYKQSTAWKYRLNCLMPHIAKQIYIGDRTEESYVDNAVLPAQEVSVEAAFLPPDCTQEQKILATYPPELLAFLDRHEKVLLANAFSLSLLNGKDLYGLDVCIKSVKGLRRQGADVGLVFVLGQVGDQQYYAFCMHMIEQYGLREHIFVMTGQKELWPLMKKVDLFVRPTLSDGASVSVQEALWCNTAVIASDVCWRPQGVVLFKTGDAGDLQRMLQEQLFGDDAAQPLVVRERNQKINNIRDERCDYTSVNAAHGNQEQI